jgi:hypothetical protein
MRMRFYAKVDRREAAEPAFNGTGTPGSILIPSWALSNRQPQS